MGTWQTKDEKRQQEKLQQELRSEWQNFGGMGKRRQLRSGDYQEDAEWDECQNPEYQEERDGEKNGNFMHMPLMATQGGR